MPPPPSRSRLTPPGRNDPSGRRFRRSRALAEPALDKPSATPPYPPLAGGPPAAGLRPMVLRRRPPPPPAVAAGRYIIYGPRQRREGRARVG